MSDPSFDPLSPPSPPIPDGPISEYDPDTGAVRASYVLKGGQIDGQYTAYGLGGVVERVAQFKAGVMHGECVHYDNGLLVNRLPMVGGVLHGEALFYDKGQLVMSLTYQNGLKHGPSTAFGNGRPVTRMTYVNDDLTGDMISLDPETGQPLSVIPLQAGQPHGTAQHFTPDGQLARAQGYHAGRLAGQTVDYAPDGKVMARRSYREGVLDGPSVRYHPNGKPQEVRSYNAGTLIGVETFDEKGALVVRHGVASGWSEPAPAPKPANPKSTNPEQGPWWKRLTGA